MQLGKLSSKIADLTLEGAAVLAISIDAPERAARLVKDLAVPFAILSDPRMDAIRTYGMKGDGMDMADIGYVVIGRQGCIRTRRIEDVRYALRRRAA